MLKFLSKTNYEQQKVFLKFQIFRRNKLYMNNLIIMVGLVIIGCLTLIVEKYEITIVAGFLIILNALMYLYLIRRLYKVNLYNKDFSEVNELLIEITYEKMDVTKVDSNDKVSIPFESIVSICELKDYIFFYVTNQQAICLDKAHIISGNIDYFIENLDPEVKKAKYRKYYRS